MSIFLYDYLNIYMNEFFIVVNLILLESILSIDNAAVLAVIVQKLPFEERGKALRYGLFGAYLFRFICLLLATWIVQITELKLIGGSYLMFLAYRHFFPRASTSSQTVQFRMPLLSQFWQTVAVVETADLIFSIDNVFAAVALTNDILLIMLGVGIGILAMRFVAGMFIRLIERYPMLEHSAFVIIFLLGMKLLVSGCIGYVSAMSDFRHILDSHAFDMAFSALMLVIFCIPFIQRIASLITKAQTE